MRNEKLEMRKEQIITRQYNLLFLIFNFFICQRYNNGFVYKKVIKAISMFFISKKL